MSESYLTLIHKLDGFIRKYYRNRLIRGSLLFLALFLVSFLLVSFLEFLGHFGTIPRTVLFYLFIISNLFILGYFIVIPLLKLSKIGKIITHEQAAAIIGKHFSEIGDKLLNTLQLQQLSHKEGLNLTLVEAGIDQKIRKLKPIPFTAAIDFRKNLKFLRYAIPPLIVIFAVMIISPSFVTRPAERIIHHTVTFAEEMPFRIIILNKNLEAFQQEDFALRVKVTGEKLPDELFIESEGITYKLSKENKIFFSYTFKAIQTNKTFRLVAGTYKTEDY
ncbi:MAG: hypothetical protein WCL00_10030 [Bacteroidota bacterium]